MDDFPVQAELVTADWLSSALDVSHGKAVLENVTVVDAHSGTTGRARLSLDWSGDGQEHLPSTVFLKLPPVEADQQAMVVEEGMGVREARFYRELSVEVPARTLHSYYSNWSDDGTRYLMVMEDIIASGGRPASIASDCTLEVAEQLMDAFGAVHGRYWGSSRFKDELDWLQPFSIRSGYGRQLVSSAVTEFSGQMPAVFTAAADLYCQHNLALADMFESGTPTLIHGDAHMGNLFLNVDHRVGFFDWALAATMPGMWDVAYVLCNSFPPELRREHEDALLRRYIAGLSAAGGPSRSVDEVWGEYRLYALYPWIAAAATLGAGERMQPREVAMRALNWSHTALEDLQVIDYVRGLLNLD